MLMTRGVISTKKPDHAILPVNHEARILLQIEKLERQLMETQRRGDLLEESRLCNNIAKKYEMLSEWQKAIHFHHFDKQISEAAGDIDGFLMALSNLARVFQEIGLDDLAMKYYQDQLEAARKEQNLPQVFWAHTSIAKLLLDGIESAVELVKREKIVEVEVALLRAHESLDAYESLVEKGLLAQSRKRDLQDLRLEARLNDGRLLLRKNDFETALAKFHMVGDGFREVGHKEREFETLGLMGQAFEGLGDYKSAIELCYDLQLSIARQIGDSPGELIALLNLALAYRYLRDFELAIDTLYLYKDHLKILSSDAHKMKEADELISEALAMKATAAEIIKLESKGDRKDRTLYKLAKGCRDLNLMEDAFLYAKQLTDRCFSPDIVDMQLTIKTTKLMCRICIERKLAEEAVYYARKLQEISSDDLDDQVERVMLLADSYWLWSTIPSDIIRLLQEIIKHRDRDQDKVITLEVLNKLALFSQRLGLDKEFHEYRNECLSLWIAIRLSNNQEGLNADTVEAELTQLDYFVNRKASKSVMKLVDGSFNMRSRIRGMRGLKLKRGARPIQLEKMTKKPRKKAVNTNGDGGRAIFSDDSIGIHNDEPQSASSSLTDVTPWPSRPDQPTSVDYHEDSCSLKALSAWGREPATFISTILRITVQVDGILMIIPVVDDIAERKTVAWLIGESAKRFQEEFGRTPLIEALLTEEGARLLAYDPVALVLRDGQKVEARITGYKNESLAVIYEKLCIEYHEIVNESIKKLLDVQTVDLSCIALDRCHLELIFQAIKVFAGFNGVIVELNLSNTDIKEDSVLKQLYAGSLDHLDLSFTTIASCSWIVRCFPQLRSLVLSFCELWDLANFIRELVRSDHPLTLLDLSGCKVDECNIGDLYLLSGIATLNLSFCPIDQKIAFELSKLVKKSLSLRILNLTGCFLDEHSLTLVISSLKTNVSIRELYLSGNCLSPHLVGLLKQILQANARLSLSKLVLPNEFYPISIDNVQLIEFL